MTRAFITFLALLLVVALSACGESATVQSNPTAAETQPTQTQPETQATVAATQPQQTQPPTEVAQPESQPPTEAAQPETQPPVQETQPAAPETNPATQPPETKAIPEQTPPATQQPISKARAIEIALQAAGLTKEAVTDLEAELDQERNGLFWEVSFETKQKEYDYEIHAYDGTVVKAETEKEENRPEVQPTEPSVQAKLTKEQAVEIALNAAGLTKEAVTDLEAELDEERNISVWEVSFETGQTEYSYEINANDGKLINAESERND